MEKDPIIARLVELNLNPADVKAKFFDKIDRSTHPKGCWIFKGPIASNGYGQVSFVRPIRHIRTHRLAMMLQLGPLPKDRLVMHACDNPPCVNPAHLSLGTHKDNSQDAKSKGRLWKQSRFLTLDQVDEVTRLLATTNMKQREIAERFACSVGIINAIKCGRYGAKRIPTVRPYKPSLMDISELVQWELATVYGRHYHPQYVDHVRTGRMKSPDLLELIRKILAELREREEHESVRKLLVAV
jgi:hypothetical protein